jgi:hypothetical protein
MGDDFAQAVRPRQIYRAFVEYWLLSSGSPHDNHAIAARLAHVDPDPIRVHLQTLQIVGETARRQASVLAVSSTLADLGWFLFASCVLVVLMAELGNGFPGRKGGTPT